MKAFKAYDIRGIWGTDLNPEMIYRIGYFLPQVLRINRIIIGRDIRASSDIIFEALAKGLMDAGVQVTNAGLTTTPMIYWATGYFEFDASVMITASHNPKNYNGIKVSGKDVLPIGYENGLNRLEKLVETADIVIERKRGSVVLKNILTDYLSFLKNFGGEYEELKLSIDCSNGMAGLLVKQLFGMKQVYLNDVPDPLFPGHEPNPLEPENQEQIKKAVQENGSDLGIIFDGDADRVMFIDEKGNFISPDLIIALMGHYFFEEKAMKGDVLQDIRSSKSVSEYLEQFGAKVHTWRVGRAYGAGKLREINGLFGGELAGHYYFRDFYFSDSGLVAALIVLNIFQKFHQKGRSFSELIQKIQLYENTGEINFKIEEKEKAMKKLLDYFLSIEKPDRILDFDGYRLDYPDFWLNIRPSNTEPYLRFIAEAKTHEKLMNVKSKVIELLQDFCQ